MSCGTLLRTRVRFSPPPPAGRSPHPDPPRQAGEGIAWLAWEGEAVQPQLEGGVVAARSLLDLEGVDLMLEDDDDRAAGRAGGGDDDLVGGDAGDPCLAHLVALGQPGLGLSP